MFFDDLKIELLKHANNYHTDNWDYFSHGIKRPFKKKLINLLKRFFFSRIMLQIFLSSDFFYHTIFLHKLYKLYAYKDGLDYMYERFADKASRELMLRLISFKILGFVKVKLPLNTPEFWNIQKQIEAMTDLSKSVALNYKPWNLFFYDLSKFGMPYKIYLNTAGVYNTYFIRQYEYNTDNVSIKPMPGDIVLDMGACYGDTAILFSDQVGEHGKVFSFEFIPGNLSTNLKNRTLNNKENSNIFLVENPVWDKADQDVFYLDAGASSHVSFSEFEGFSGKTKTISIDAFVKKYNVEKVDFIKSDIEGAEPYALKGAIETLKLFKPRLAISIYHGMNDFTGILKYIDELNLGYKFYLRHASIYGGETVLFAKV